MKRTSATCAALACAVALATVLAACGGGKFSGKDIRLGEAAAFRLEKQEGVRVRFEGGLGDLDKAAERLYRWIRQQGRFFGGPLLLALETWPEFGAKGEHRLAGWLFFPLAPGEGKAEYTDEKLGIAPEKHVFAGGEFQSVVYQGQIEWLEAGFARLREAAGGAGGGPVLVFEDTFKALDKKRQIRLLAGAGGRGVN